MSFKLEQLSNALLPIKLTLLGKLMVTKAEHPLKAWAPILVMLLEANVTLVSEVMFSKAPRGVLVVVVWPLVVVVSSVYPVIALTLAGITMLAKALEWFQWK